MSLSGPTEFEAVSAEDGLSGAGLQGDGDPSPDATRQEIAGRSLTSIAWRRLRQDRIALVGGVVVVLFVLIAVFAGPITALYGQDYATQHNTGSSLLDPLTQMPKGDFSGVSGKHWLGVTPVLGLDIAANLIYGARTSLIVGFLATALSLVLGVALGIIAGFSRGWVDIVISRLDGRPAVVPDAAVLDRAHRRLAATSTRPRSSGSRSSSSSSASSAGRTSAASSEARC